MSHEPAIRWNVVDNVCVSYSNASLVISDDEFDRWLRTIIDPKIRAVLATSDGRLQMTSAQWRRGAAMGHLGKPGALVSTDRVTRAMATAAGWAGANCRGFDWPQFDAALEFIAIPPASWSIYADAAHSLRQAANESARLTGST